MTVYRLFKVVRKSERDLPKQIKQSHNTSTDYDKQELL
jgi:hypothetical protein